MAFEQQAALSGRTCCQQASDRLAAGIQNPMFGIHHQSTFTVDKN